MIDSLTISDQGWPRLTNSSTCAIIVAMNVPAVKGPTWRFSPRRSCTAWLWVHMGEPAIGAIGRAASRRSARITDRSSVPASTSS
jgi:hypothetical protein